MKKRTIKSLSALLIASMIALTACGNQSANNNSASEENKTQEVSKATSVESQEEVKEIVPITVYPTNAYGKSGTISGNAGEFFAEHGLEVEMWSVSDDKTTAILASGDLPDIMYVNAASLETMIQADMILPLEDYLDQMPNWEKYYDVLGTAENYIREYRSNGTGKVYALPNTVGAAAQQPIPDTSTMAWKIRWDMYEGIGAPEINSYDELVDVMVQMKEKYPTDAEGNTMFGTVLNSGGDSVQFKMITQWYNMNGYDNGNAAQSYLLEMNMVTGEVSSILEEDSMYRQGLEWYNKLYRNGLIDPDSINTDRDTQGVKIDKGLAYVPSGFLPGYKPYYYPFYIEGTNVYYSTSLPYGATNGYIVVNKKTTNLEACLEYLNLMIDPFTAFRLNFGPEGDAWYIDGDKLLMTDRMKSFMEKNNWSYVGYVFENGEEFTLFNVPMVLYNGEKLDYKDENGDYRYWDMQFWSELAAAEESNETWSSWQKTTGYDNYVELLEDKGALYTDGPLNGVSSFLTTTLPDDIKLLRSTVASTVVSAAWKMVYADTEEEFNQIWDQMIADCEKIGAKELQDWRMADIENAKAIVESLKK